MGYDRDDSFPFYFEPNGIPFGSKSKGKLLPCSCPIQCERKWNTSFLSVRVGCISVLLVLRSHRGHNCGQLNHARDMSANCSREVRLIHTIET